MDFEQPRDLDEALAAKAARPELVPIAGGTDVMVAMNHSRERPAGILDLNRVAELQGWSTEPDGRLRIGASVPYTQLIDELGHALPALAMAARTVGSPQIRNRGTIAGNLATASPAGDCHPPLLATGADVEAVSVRGTRRIAIDAFYRGVKRSTLEADELIAAVLVPVRAGPQQFSKVGTRNAMVIAVCSMAIALDEGSGTVRVGIGSAGPTPLRAPRAEAFLTEALTAGAGAAASALERFGELVAEAARPIDDVRGTAAYRRRAIAVMARRTASWCLHEREGGDRACA